jgi:hypothetical protein
MINGFPTHNRFSAFSALLTVMEIRPLAGVDEVISLSAQDISLTCNLSPELAFNPPGTDHTVDAKVLGTNVSGIDVTFGVISGPNNGDSGTDTTDAAGEASFTYTGDGGIGVDEIHASFEDASGNPKTCDPAFKIWDLDCQPNSIPDTCDIDCNAYNGKCNDFPGCGGSLDVDGNGKPDECNVDPVCTGAFADPGTLWPPNHEGVPIAIAGVTDADGDPLTITATSVTQDEAVTGKGIGSGNTTPDAQLSPLAVRSERNGNPKTPGDGRVYHVSFTADDGQGGSCDGLVFVCVPHDRRPGSTCIDGGPLYNSIP